MALIPIQPVQKKQSGGLLSKIGGGLGTLVGAGIGTLVAPGAGTAIGASLGGALGGVVQGLDTPGRSKLTSVSGGVGSLMNSVVQAKTAANADPHMPEPTRIDLNKQFDEALTALQRRNGMGNAQFKGGY